MIRTDNIRSLTDFRENAKAHLERLHREGGVEVLTVKGEARGVLMSPKAFDEMNEKVRQAETTAAILKGMREIAAGEGVDGRAAMRAIAEKHGLTIDG